MSLSSVLVHIHTFNDADVVEAALDAVANQTRRVQAVIAVDNASSDDTPEKLVSRGVRVLRHAHNCGTSGSVATGLRYAAAHDFDWIWILDADSRPRPDALEKLLDLYASFDPSEQNRIGVLASSQYLATGELHVGKMLTPGGPRLVDIDPRTPYCDVDTTIWSGSMINVGVARRIGPPRFGPRAWIDLGLDYGDLEYMYRIKRAGYRVLVHRSSILDHPVGATKQISVLGRKMWSTNHSPDRRYLLFRNLVFFWFYLYASPKNWLTLPTWFLYRLSATVLGIMLLEADRWPKVRACFRGILDGFRKDLQHGLETHSP
jgi:rhamnopyranosyl-N-acetylglucosaminyl-diphospho-decaprenol beta-1,3/1,4-galactofuranosyltransferase